MPFVEGEGVPTVAGFSSRVAALTGEEVGTPLLILDQSSDFLKQLHDKGLITLSGDGSHAVANNSITIYSMGEEKNPDGTLYEEGTVLLDLRSGEHLERGHFVQPEEPKNKALIRAIAEQIQLRHLSHQYLSLSEAVTYPFSFATVSVASHAHDIPAEAIESKKIHGPTGGIRLSNTLVLRADKQSNLQARLATHGSTDIPIAFYTSVVDGAGKLWIRMTDAMKGLRREYVFIYDDIQSHEAALVRIEMDNPLYLRKASSHNLQIVLEALIDQEWQFNLADNSMDLYQIHMGQLSYPGFLVSTGEPADAVRSMVAHDIRVSDLGFNLQGETLHGHLYNQYKSASWGIQLFNSSVLKIQLSGGRWSPKSIIREEPGHALWVNRNETLLGTYLFPHNPLVSPDGEEVRAVMVTSRLSFLEQVGRVF